MSIKVILVPVDDRPDASEALGRALLVARRFDAHVRALHVAGSALDPAERMSNVPAIQREQIREQAQRDARARAGRVRALVAEACEREGVPLVDGPHDTGKAAATGTAAQSVATAATGASVEWVEDAGDVADTIVRHGRLSDVVVMSRPRRAGADEIFRAPAGRNLEAVMLGTGRPLLIVPPKDESVVAPGLVRRVAIGWNESQEAARALSQAMPWLAQMESVTLIVSRARRPSADAVLAYLGRHGVTAGIETLDRGERSAGAALLEACRRLEAEILVVGAFSHSRARQRLFGGVTRHLLAAASVITLMVH